MIIAYIKEGRIENGILSRILGIEVKNFENNYIITISNKNKKSVKQNLIKYIKKLKIDTIVFSKELENEFKQEICILLEKINILNGKKLMEYMEFEILKYITNKQNTSMNKEDIYIVFKREINLDLNFLKQFIQNFKTVNVVTNDIERLKNVQDNLLENDGILISISNNKRKALKRAKYIINLNLNKEELEKYKINRDAIIINIKEDVKYNVSSFDGVNINYFGIDCPDEYMEKFEQIGENFDIVKLYESILICYNAYNMKIESVYERISKDNIKITELIGNNGRISDEELRKIHKANLDKMRKLV